MKYPKQLAVDNIKLFDAQKKKNKGPTRPNIGDIVLVRGLWKGYFPACVESFPDDSKFHVNVVWFDSPEIKWLDKAGDKIKIANIKFRDANFTDALENLVQGQNNFCYLAPVFLHALRDVYAFFQRKSKSKAAKKVKQCIDFLLNVITAKEQSKKRKRESVSSSSKFSNGEQDELIKFTKKKLKSINTSSSSSSSGSGSSSGSSSSSSSSSNNRTSNKKINTNSSTSSDLPSGWKMTTQSSGGKIHTHKLHGKVRSLAAVNRLENGDNKRPKKATNSTNRLKNRTNIPSKNNPIVTKLKQLIDRKESDMHTNIQTALEILQIINNEEIVKKSNAGKLFTEISLVDMRKKCEATIATVTSKLHSNFVNSALVNTTSTTPASSEETSIVVDADEIIQAFVNIYPDRFFVM
jgi:hypothetical protein